MKILPLLLLVAACSSVPGTGRSRLNLVPLSSEMSLGQDAWSESLKTAKLITSGADYEMVQRVGQRIANAAIELYPDPAAEFAWEFVLIDEAKTANAWALPGGKSAVYTGLLPITQDEASLAAVVGHEVAHAIARHGAERMSQGLLLNLGMTAAEAGTAGKMTPANHDLLMQALSGVGTLGFVLPFSRKHESEADELGLYIAASAGYDPQAAIGLWDRMAKSAPAGRPPEFLSTHPSEESRVGHLQEIMPEAERLYRESSHP